MNRFPERIQKFLGRHSKSILAIALGASIVTALIAYFDLSDVESERNKLLHQSLARNFENAFEYYQHPLQGISAMLHYANLDVNASDFRNAAINQEFFKSYKGALGFGFIRRVEISRQDEYLNSIRRYRPDFLIKHLPRDEKPKSQNFELIIEVVEPSDRNQKAIGLDISDETNRNEGAISAIHSGLPTITRSIQLVQADKKEAGFLLYLPVYETLVPPSTPDERESKLVGLAYAPLLAGEIAAHVIDRSGITLPFRASELSTSGSKSILFETPDFQKSADSGLPIIASEIHVAGQKWELVTTGGSKARVDLRLKAGALAAVLILLSMALYYYFRLVHERGQFDRELVARSQAEVAQATKEISTHRQFLQSIIEGIPVSLAVWGKDGSKKLANERYRKLLTEDGGEGNADAQSTALIGESRLRHALTGISSELELIFYGANNAEQILKFQVNPLKIGKAIDGAFAIGVDISDIRKLEAANREHQGQLFAKSKLSLLGEMASGIAHEINNPLAIITGKTTLLINQLAKVPAPEGELSKIREALEVIRNTAMRIASIIKGLRSFSRDSGADPHESIKLAEIISETLNLVSERLRSRGIELTVAGVLDNYVLTCNKIQIEQVLMNLIQNSMDAVTFLEEKWIAIEVHTDSAKLVVSVVDSGIGIPQNIVEKMMTPFFTTKEVGKGTGLGLSICKGILDKHAATIAYRVVRGHTGFVIEFPNWHA
jgi:C4-dicarboxylate-specific signal transduction histidine kinase